MPVRILSALLVLIVALGSAQALDKAPYEEAVGEIIGAAMLSEDAYANLAYLCDRFGHRLSGTETLEDAIDWSLEIMESMGLENVRKEEVMVPVWVRGKESGRILEPAAHRLNLLGLGRSVGTPPEGLRADVVVVQSFEELDQLGREKVEGKIVVYDTPFTTYGETVKYRGDGPSRAAGLGAVATLVRSIGPKSYDTPHTGSLRYEEGVPQIPGAAITIENSTQMRRMQERGERVVVELNMGARTHEDRLSHNAIAEIRGRELPEEIVLIGGHIDSWDVGQGAQDDGAGCIIAMEAAHLLKQLNLRPRRTIRVVLFTNEENGLRGGRQYRDDHTGELERHVAAIETDTGNGLASGFRVDVRSEPYEGATEDPTGYAAALADSVVAQLNTIASLLEPLGANSFFAAFSGADIMPMAKEGVLGFGMHHDTSEYFNIHHTQADTFDKIVKEDLNQNVAIMAVMAYLMAELPERLLPWPHKGS